jgi:hypothetical protein
MSEDLLRVRRQWNDCAIGTVKLESFGGAHWDVVSGGVRQVAIRPFIHGYVWCNEIIDGAVSHSCAHGAGPHRIKVCVTKTDNEPEIFAKVRNAAGTPNSSSETPEERERRLIIRRARKRFRAALFDKRVATVLIAAGIDDPERLVSMDRADIAALPGIGPKAAAKIETYRNSSPKMGTPSNRPA